MIAVTTMSARLKFTMRKIRKNPLWKWTSPSSWEECRGNQGWTETRFFKLTHKFSKDMADILRKLLRKHVNA
jgi:hypothetical protein